ncbi:hypothetical protein [Rhodoferax ferrireducens]|uniref:hypothetical protein n=1 Tax=Rhodoferax ferrireducens TaxID=192843 RepID=UPI000E0DEAC3|nr:hypothetical protein [Rhodoferax ferrireducens]
MNTLNRLGLVTLVLGASLSPWAAMAAGGVALAKTAAASTVEKINGSALKKITLSQRAAERLDIKTGQVAVNSSGIMTAPYGALLYDRNGKTWAYTNPEPLVYVRHAVVVESIKGGVAFLKEGPPAGTVVVVVGASELHGIESGVGH